MTLINKKQKRIHIKVPSIDREFENIKTFLEEIPFFIKNNYDIAVPDHLMFKEIASNKKALADVDEEELKKVFIEHEYNSNFYKKSVSSISASLEHIDDYLKRLEILQDKWSFKLFSTYTIHLTKYGPGGSYDHKGGELTIKVIKDGVFHGQEPRETIMHEIIHIGIEENIIRQYNLNANEKERLVDVLCMKIFSDIFPNYSEQESEDRAIDKYLVGDMLGNLPQVIENFVSHSPRKSKFL